MKRSAGPTNDRHHAFTQWVRTHGSVVLKISRAYTINEDERQDLSQEILLRCWRSLHSFDGRSALSTWCYRVALNTAMNWRRDDARRRRGQVTLVEPATVPSVAPEADHAVVARETLDRMYDAIHRLSKTDTALVLMYLDEMSYADIAEISGITESNVGVRLTRARRKLRELMRDRDDD